MVEKPELINIAPPGVEDERRTYQFIGNSLMQRILKGEFKASGRLPTERSLAASYGVGRTILRGALVMLEVKGVIETRQGSGHYIISQNGNLNGMYNADAYSAHVVSDCMDIFFCQQNFISNISLILDIDFYSSKISKLENVIECIDGAENWKDLMALDFKFQKEIVGICKNIEFIKLFCFYWWRRSLSQHSDDFNSRIYGSNSRYSLLRSCKRTLAFLKEGNSDGVSQSIWMHYESQKKLATETGL